MCLCGMMAAEYETLPTPMQDAVVRFFDENERWLARVLEQGRKDGDLAFYRASKRDSPDDREWTGRGDARRPALRRHHAVSKCHSSPALRTSVHGRKSRSISERLEGRHRRAALAD